MRRRLFAPFVLLALTSAVLTGCASSELAIFDRERTSADELPSGAGDGLDIGTSRYVGQDSSGHRYWVAYAEGVQDACIILLAGDEPFHACGGGSMSMTIEDGTTVEFLHEPSKLSTGTAEVIGDTLLVGVAGT